MDMTKKTEGGFAYYWRRKRECLISIKYLILKFIEERLIHENKIFDNRCCVFGAGFISL
jgi:hypothetical protein